jgi:16S rRNA (uracil1498-N3)-methyltransferase
MDRIMLDRVLNPNEEVSIEGPPMEAFRFQKGRPGALITLTDALGRDFRGRVLFVSEEKASVWIFSQFPSPTESPLEIVLLQALPEKERMELIIQKTTELGVSRIIPFKSKRSISLEEREAKQKKAHRWQDIALKATQQSRRALIPRVEAYRSFEEALASCTEEGLRILLWERQGESLRAVLDRCRFQRVYGLVGPEGGLTESEVEAARQVGFLPVKLGQRVLRTETAAIILVALLQYAWGDLR